MPAIGRALGRSEKSLEIRMRKLIPPGQRRCPGDQVLATLLAAASAPGYAWRETIRLDDPLPPVTQVVRSGLAGLGDEELVECTFSLGLTSPSSPTFELLRRAVDERDLCRQVRERYTRHRRATGAPDILHDGEIATEWCTALGMDCGFPPRHRDWDEPYRY